MTKTRPAKRFAALGDDLDALASPQRLAILHFLTRPRAAQDIAEHLGMSPQAARRHLRKLRARGLVLVTSGRTVLGPTGRYALAPSRLFEVARDVDALTVLRGDRRDPSGILQGAERAAIEEAGTPHLRVVNGPDRWGVFPLDGGTQAWHVGLAAGNDLRLWHDPTVTSVHAELRRVGGELHVANLAGRDALGVDGERVDRKRPVVLPVGAVLQVGGTFLVHQRRTPKT